MNHRVQPFFAVLIALGAFGFIYAAVTNPGQMISRAITVIIAGVIIYFIVRSVLNRRADRDGTAFKKAAKQSRLRMKEQKAKHRAAHRGRVSHLRSVPSSSRPKPMILKKKSQTQLTVIEGKKNKKKNRALF
ncbi:SA1362 family protein [Bacillus amyloliquefaciens]|uniref:SA1362 family protein n=1 Tax=Bacillus amyloliquefaciens TaxID=1390 RepID=UPI0025A02761|nr:SA1362 family protein [Bacillus amyloliquefaciens]WJM60361.1 SA1362 family protein [Bacillus amyloliquefaciens]